MTVDYQRLDIEQLLRFTERKGIDELIYFLEYSDYFRAPGSTTFHNRFIGGLAKHSLDVTSLLFKKSRTCKIGLTAENIIITGLLHDLCKVNYYKLKEQPGHVIEFAGDPEWEIRDVFPIGHGEKSLVIAMSYIDVALIEQMMIRWHMGTFELGGVYTQKSWIAAQEMYPAIVAAHTADFEASAFFKDKFMRPSTDEIAEILKRC